ncbi:hypothetical protein [Neptunitalea chrysea]|nr:hypothetical protein [Neptunitalea chrysea]
MKYLLCLLLGLTNLSIVAQEYKDLEDKAYELTESTKDTIANAQEAFSIFTSLHEKYPEKDDFWNLYYTAYAANRCGKENEVFHWLEKTLTHYNEVDVAMIEEYAPTDFSSIYKTEQWKLLQNRIDSLIKIRVDAIKQTQSYLMLTGLATIDFDGTEIGKEMYYQIKNFHSFPMLNQKEIFGFIRLNDTLENSYFVKIPTSYTPEKQSKVLLFLPGAVRFQKIPSYPTTELENDWQRFYKKYAEKYNIIMVYPNCSKEYNWMLKDKGFFMIPEILKQLKTFLNIDDNGVFISGHSNGATGSFNYLVKNPSEFSGFYGFNTQPKVYTGGTFLKNVSNRYFYNVSTDQDYYFPPEANDTLTLVAKKVGLQFLDHRYIGYPHWFPKFDASEPAVKGVFQDVLAHERNPYNDTIYWECDDVKNGKVDWLAITKLDTLSKRASWHKKIDFGIHKWYYITDADTLAVKEVDKRAFDFPRKSGAVKAVFNNNTFYLETSCVNQVTVYVSPEMVEMDKPIHVYVNGVLRKTIMPAYDKAFIQENFEMYHDRKAIWVQKIVI